MPNHVINNIRISGDPALIRELLESVQADEQSLGSIDFNKIIPMPESLKIECGSNTDKELKAFTDFTQVYTLAGTREDADIENIPKEAEKHSFVSVRTSRQSNGLSVNSRMRISANTVSPHGMNGRSTTGVPNGMLMNALPMSSLIIQQS